MQRIEKLCWIVGLPLVVCGLNVAAWRTYAGRGDPSVVPLHHAVEDPCRSADQQVKLGKSKLDAGDLKAAVEAFSEAIRLCPSHTEAKKLKEGVIWRHDRYDELVKEGESNFKEMKYLDAISKARKAKELLVTDTKKADDLFERSETAQKAYEAEVKRTQDQTAQQKRRSEFEALKTAGMAAYGEKKYETAIDKLTQAQALYPEVDKELKDARDALEKEAIAESQRKELERIALAMKKMVEGLLREMQERLARERELKDKAYNEAITTARREFAEKKYEKSLAAAELALTPRPGDAEATKLSKESKDLIAKTARPVEGDLMVLLVASDAAPNPMTTGEKEKATREALHRLKDHPVIGRRLLGNQVWVVLDKKGIQECKKDVVSDENERFASDQCAANFKTILDEHVKKHLETLAKNRGNLPAPRVVLVWASSRNPDRVGGKVEVPAGVDLRVCYWTLEDRDSTQMKEWFGKNALRVLIPDGDLVGPILKASQ